MRLDAHNLGQVLLSSLLLALVMIYHNFSFPNEDLTEELSANFTR